MWFDFRCEEVKRPKLSADELVEDACVSDEIDSKWEYSAVVRIGHEGRVEARYGSGVCVCERDAVTCE